MSTDYAPHCLKLCNIDSLLSWTAISRGAVIHGMNLENVDSPLSIKVASRSSRASYGVVCWEHWDDKKHVHDPQNISGDKSFIDEKDDVHKAKDQMKWLIKKVRYTDL